MMTTRPTPPTGDTSLDPAPPPAVGPEMIGGGGGRRRRRPNGSIWRGLSWPQLAVVALASVAPAVIVVAVVAGLLGLIATDAMIELALAAGENPGMITFGAMFLASPVQWLTRRSQVRVRKFLGITFFGLALSNAVMFALEQGVGAMLGAPFLVAGSVALGLALPLFLTSSRWSQRALGLRRWRLLHKLTYVVAVALLAHVVLVGDLGLGSVLITAGFVARVPAVRGWLEARGRRRAAARAGAGG